MSVVSARAIRRGSCCPGGRPARPHQAVATDDAVVVVSEIGVAHRPAECHCGLEPAADRLGGHHISPDRQQRARDARHQLAEMDIAGEHHVIRTQPSAGRGDALANAGGVDRQRRRLLEDARARRLRRGRKTERVVQRMDVERLRRVHRVEIVVALEHVAHALDRPAFDLAAELLADQTDGGEVVVGVIRFRDLEPALLDRIDAGHIGVADRGAHVVEAGLRERPQRLGVVEPDPLDHRLHVASEARQHEAGVAAGRVPGDRVRLDHHHRPAAARHFARGGQPGEAGADHADIDVDIAGHRGALGRADHRIGIPG